jgi:inhibitor of KinA
MIFRPVAGHALLVECGETPSEAVHAQVLGLDAALAAAPPEGLCETVPAFVNLLLIYDPCRTDPARLEAAIRALPLAHSQIRPESHTIPTRYDGRDLAEVARQTGLRPEEIGPLHATGDYRVRLYGFAPGYAYLDGLPAALRLDRKPQPVRDVPAGSVIIAGGQCLITTLTMPTGWWIIGRTALGVLTGDPDRPFRFAVGDALRFEPLSCG